MDNVNVFERQSTDAYIDNQGFTIGSFKAQLKD